MNSNKQSCVLQAIRTRFHGATNSRDSRVTATACAGKVTVSWDHALDVDDNHRAAAEALAKKMGWSDQITTGSLHDGDYVHVITPRAAR